MCIQMGKTVEDPNRMRFETQEFYIKSEDEMASLFPKSARRLLKIRRKIAERCNVEFTFGKLPPAGIRSAGRLDTAGILPSSVQ